MNDRETGAWPAWLKWGGIALFVGWLFYALSAYYVVQKPFSVAEIAALVARSDMWWRLDFSAAALVRSALDVGAALWLALAALGFGAVLLARFPITAVSAGERLLLSLGLGFGGLGLLVMGLGLVGVLETAVFYAVALVGTVLAIRPLLALGRALRVTPPPLPIALFLIATLGLAFILALMPPTSWDSLSYHLQGPALYLDTGRIIPGPDNPPLHYPALFEMLFMLGMGVRGDATATLLHTFFAFILAGMVCLTARRHLGLAARHSWTAVLLLAAIPMVPLVAAWAYNDLPLSFYQLAAVYLFLRWRDDAQDGWLILAGVMAGLAMGIKYTAFVAPVVLVGLILWTRRRDWREAIRPLLLFSLPALSLLAPWLLKNWAFTGNPVYPFVFNGRFWDDFRAASYANAGTGIGFDLLAWVRLPYDLSLGYKDVAQDGPVGPLFLLLLPLLLAYGGLTRWRRRTPPAWRILLLLALGQYLFWMVGVIASRSLWQSRYLLPGLAALCPALAWLLVDLAHLDHPQFSLQRYLYLVVGVAVALGLVGQVLDWLPQAPLAYVIGSDSREEVLRRRLGAYYGAIEAINELPEGSVVQFLWEPRTYYCRRTCWPDVILDKMEHLIYLHGDAAGIAAAWEEAGVTHILLYQGGLDLVAAAAKERGEVYDTAVVQTLQVDYLRPVADVVGAYILYELGP